MNITVFNNSEFGEIRTVEENDRVLFCGSDVARALGYARPSDAITAHCRYTVKHSIYAFYKRGGRIFQYRDKENAFPRKRKYEQICDYNGKSYSDCP